MQPCATVGCGKWVAYGTHCAKHESAPEPAKAKAKESRYKHANAELVRSIPAVDATEVRVTPRPRVTTPKPWTHVRGGTKGLSDVLVTKPDGTQYTIPLNRRKRESHDVKQRESKVDHRVSTLMQLATTKDRHDYNAQ